MGNNSSGKLGGLALGLWKGWGCLSRLDLKDATGKRYRGRTDIMAVWGRPGPQGTSEDAPARSDTKIMTITIN